MAKFTLKYGAAVIKEYPLKPDKLSVTVGRKPDNDIVIDNPIVSGYHARIVKQGELYFIEDLDSTNGTFIGGRKILKSGLSNGDEVVIGSHSVVFYDDSVKKAEEPVKREASIDQTMVIDASKKEELLGKSAQAAQSRPAAGGVVEKIGTMVVTSGSSAQSEYELSGLVTYIGKSENAHIKIKGMFVPEMAAAINKRQEGYVLVALKDGFPEVNGRKITGQITLNDGDELKTGGITFRFYIKEVTK